MVSCYLYENASNFLVALKLYFEKYNYFTHKTPFGIESCRLFLFYTKPCITLIITYYVIITLITNLRTQSFVLSAQCALRAGRFAMVRRFSTRGQFCEPSVYRRNASTWSRITFNDWWRCLQDRTSVRHPPIIVLQVRPLWTWSIASYNNRNYVSFKNICSLWFLHEFFY